MENQYHTHQGCRTTMKRTTHQLKKRWEPLCLDNKFSDYCYGRHVTIESDHKPLEAISKKPLSEVPKRLLRMVLLIQKFDYKITYKKGSDIIITDALSRAPVEDDNFPFNFSEVNLLEFLAVSEQTRDRLVSATKEDKDLLKLIKLIKQGFPMQYKVLEAPV